MQNACQVYSVESVSKIKSGLSIIFSTIKGCVYFQLTHVYPNDCENYKYESLAIV